jgi:ribose transport system permease protein
MQKGREREVSLGGTIADDVARAAAPDEVRSRLARLRRGAVGRVLGYNELGVAVALGLMIALIGGFHPRFLEIFSLANIGQQASFYGFMALAMVFLLAMGELDLSVGGVYVLTTLLGAILVRDGLDPWIGGVLCIVIGAGLGGINGLIANALRIPVIIVTLGTLSAYRGLGLIVSHSGSVGGQPLHNSFYRVVGGQYLKVPASVWVFAFMTIVLSILFTKTRFGFAVRAIGANREAARLSGYPVGRIRVLTTTLVGALGGLSGAMTLAFFGAADPNLGIGYELQVIAAAIIGGTAVTGGSGSVVGAFMGALIISVIGAGLIQFGVSSEWSVFVTGVIIVGAVSLDALVRRRRSARRLVT